MADEDDTTQQAMARFRKKNAVQGVIDALVELVVADRRLAEAEGRRPRSTHSPGPADDGAV